MCDGSAMYAWSPAELIATDYQNIYLLTLAVQQAAEDLPHTQKERLSYVAAAVRKSCMSLPR